ncbi:hypothetical protein [Qipengyuania sp. MTN3-11]|uniref:hypothetical protein n=1 Tax=Qipengyuania sp. MTN3-11 TaxID=3056557 RepID=UPI0036F21A17
MNDIEPTNLALVHVAKMQAQMIMISAHCALAIEEAGLLDDGRAQSIVRSMRALAELLDDTDRIEPGGLAKALHRTAQAIEAGHPSPDEPSRG